MPESNLATARQRSYFILLQDSMKEHVEERLPMSRWFRIGTSKLRSPVAICYVK